MSTATITATSPPSAPPARTIVLWVIAGTTVLSLCLPGAWFGYAALLGLSVLVLVYVVAATLQGRVGNVIVGWVLIFPLGYYFLSYPSERPLITLDRVFIGILL